MKASYDKLIKGNEEWVKQKLALDADYFSNLAKGQKLWFLSFCQITKIIWQKDRNQSFFG